MSSRLLLEMVQASPDALVVVDESGLVEAATPGVAAIFGYRPEDLVGQPIEMLLPAAVREKHKGLRNSFLERAEPRPMGLGLQLRARRRDGTEFPVDVSLVPTRLGGRLRVGAFVRDATERRRDEDLLRFVNEISQRALVGGDAPELLHMVSANARRLVGAAAAWVAIRSRGIIEVAAADGIDADALLGSTVPVATSLAAKAMESGQRVSVDDMASEPAVLPAARAVGLGPGIYLPMLAEGEPVGSLVLARRAGSAPFSNREVAAAEIFASAAAIVVALDTGRRAVEETRMTSEHERIARDLHDTVIQRLFALGMKLQATERLADGVVAQRIGDVVESIDQVIREIREAVFDLNHPDAESSRLRQLVRGVASEATEHLGFTPRIAFRGPVEAVITEEVGRHLGSVLREALANVGRHARASNVDVVVVASEDFITLSVADNGIGISDAPTAGNGTSNMARRAEALGGEFTISRRDPAGTLLQWRVPTGS